MGAFLSAACHFDSFELHSMYECYLSPYLIREILIGRLSVSFTCVPRPIVSVPIMAEE